VKERPENTGSRKKEGKEIWANRAGFTEEVATKKDLTNTGRKVGVILTQKDQKRGEKACQV